MEETGNPTSCPALGDYPIERRGEKERTEKGAATRGSENDNNIPAAQDIFTLKKDTF